MAPTRNKMKTINDKTNTFVMPGFFYKSFNPKKFMQ